MRQNDLLCAQPPVGAEPVNAVQIGGSVRLLWFVHLAVVTV